MGYMSPVRRRARRISHLASAATNPQLWRGGVIVPATWWVGEANFGDDLTRWLLPRFGVLPVHRRPAESRIAAVGSILGMLPHDYSGVVWGSGLIHPTAHPLPNATILGVRGPLTRDLVGAHAETVLGDPGLLVRRFVRRGRPRWRVGVVPRLHHRSNAEFVALGSGEDARVIDVRQSAPRAVAEIGACEAIVTTSLHGLVTADALGIPAVWTSLDPPHEQGDFKFADYEAVITPGTTRHVPFTSGTTLEDMIAHAGVASPATVERVVDGLWESGQKLQCAFPDAARFPGGVFGSGDSR
ncbi:polysaccharide pyruvyl transferase family protein [Microbacterium lacus]|uniref:polysaccharide pyruvyl transferase family protein n=1 Tax=Microbacterium lacus TaxID=415217 RepID=UPI0038517E8D